MADARAWAAEHGTEVEGLGAQEAEQRVRAAGLHPRTVAPESVVTLEFRPDRITLHTDADGVVTAARPG